MWIATQHGFYSIVQKKPAEYHVRGRTRQDLENLLALTGLDLTIEEWPLADYRYRVITKRQGVSVIMSSLAMSLDYSNFKSTIARTPDQRDKLDAYHDTWEALAEMQV